jgi:putative hydrolase of HD superfamily
MKNILNFLLKVGKLKNVERKGITFYGVKNPDSATDHTFRMAIMVWLFGFGRKIQMEKALKLALIHDISKVLTGDITPYDGLLPTDKKTRDKFVRRWVRLPLVEKRKRYLDKFKRERHALKKLIQNLPEKTKKEIINLWIDYFQMKSAEAKLVHQIDVMENLLEAIECWEKDKNFPILPWWEHLDEVIEDPILLNFLKIIEKEKLKVAK